jgi:hypothetical protein
MYNPDNDEKGSRSAYSPKSPFKGGLYDHAFSFSETSVTR